MEREHAGHMIPDAWELCAEVTAATHVGPGTMQLTVHAPEIAATCAPGQFVMVKCAHGQDPLLPRPFTVYRTSSSGDVHLLVREMGRGSRWLTCRKVGDRLHLTGPLGTGFVISPDLSLAILVGGGTGVAALGLLAADLCRREALAVLILVGAHTRTECLCVDDFSELCGASRVRVWVTRRGLEEELDRLALHLDGVGPETDRVEVFAAGPLGMLRRISDFALERRILCQVSVETRMACGLGVCQSCICKDARGDGYRLVCKEGPVFDSRAVVL